jgi:hypothetical protein
MRGSFATTSFSLASESWCSLRVSWRSSAWRVLHWWLARVCWYNLVIDSMHAGPVVGWCWLVCG